MFSSERAELPFVRKAIRLLSLAEGWNEKIR
jgi:hypothetical protein